MADNVIETRGLTELIGKLKMFPTKLRQLSELGMQASLLTLWENVPSYPPEPDNSSYDRTGTLGRTLGSSESGGKNGKPDIYEVKKVGSGLVEGRFGTRLDYAEYVIGENQAWMHEGRWWKLTDIIPLAKDKIQRIWNGIAQKAADWLDAKSSGGLGQ